MPVVGFRVDKKTYEILRKRAEEENTTISDLLRFALEKCLGIEMRTPIEKRLEELERRVQELEKQFKQRAGLTAYMRR